MGLKPYQKEDVAFFAELYKSEHERNEKLTATLTIPSGALVAVAGFAALLAD